jgi:hypothetical protein
VLSRKKTTSPAFALREGVTVSVRTVRLTCSEFYVDARLTEVDGRWLASADTSNGPGMGTGDTPEDALVEALQPFEGAIDELIACLPPDLARQRQSQG